MDDRKKEAFIRRCGECGGKKKIPYQNMAKGGIVKLAGGGELGPGMIGGGQAAGVSGPTTGGTIGNAVNPNNQGFTGGIGGLLGLNNTFQAAGAPVQAGTNASQLNAAYTGVQGAINNQTALQAQAAQQGGFNNQANVFNQQQALANQLQEQSLGGGPNPALAQLNQATGQNVANQAALMASQRGASANPGLIAREAAQQGAATQQQAVGQAATMRAQQQLAAEQQLAGQQAQLQGVAANQIGAQGQATTNLTNAQLGEQGQLQQANTALNNNVAAQQGNINNVNSQVAQANANSNSNVLSGIANAASSVGSFIGGLFAHGGPVALAEGGKVNLGTVGGPGASAAGAPGAAIPGTVALPTQQTPDWAKKRGGMPGQTPGAAKTPDEAIDPNAGSTSAESLTGPMSSGGIDNAGGSIYGGGANFRGPMQPGLEALPATPLARGGNVHPGPHDSHVANYLMTKGEKIPALVSPGEVYLSPEKVRQVLAGADPMKIGQKITGKVQVKGDSKKNDTVPMTLEKGGCVIPRHIATHKMNKEKAELFVRRSMAMKRAS